LTPTVQAIFKTFLCDEHSKYIAVYLTIYDGKADCVDEVFGIGTSRSLLINANSNNHQDVKYVCYGWCVIVEFGDFTGSHACFPELGVKIDFTPGM